MTEIIVVHAATPPWSAVLAGWLIGGIIVLGAVYALSRIRDRKAGRR